MARLRQLFKWIKVIFFFTIVIIVGVEFKQLLAQTSLDGISEGLAVLKWWQVLGMLVAGILAVLPSLGYDHLFLESAGKKISFRELLRTSYGINGIDNFVGFGGLVSVTLRTSYYSDESEEDKRRFIQLCTNTVPFLISGMGAMSLIAFILTWFDTQAYSLFNQLILLMMAIGIPTVLIGFNKLNTGYVGDVPVPIQIKYTITSTFEWAAYVACFLLIGQFLGYHFSWITIFVGVILAEIAGYFSFIPGSIGSFDLVMIGFLTLDGFTYEQSMIWVLLFRIAYYVVPFIIASVIFLDHFLKKYTTKTKEQTKFFLENVFHLVAIGMMLLSAVVLIVSATIPDQLRNVAWLNTLNPVYANLIWQFPSLLIGYLLVLISRLLINKQHLAFNFSMVLLTLTLLYGNVTGFSLATSIYIVIIMMLIWLSRSLLYRQQFIYSWEAGTIDMITVTGLTLLFIFFYWYNSPITGQKQFTQLMSVFHDQHTVGLLVFLIMIIAIVWWGLLEFMKRGHVTIGEEADTERARQLLERYGGHDDSGLVLLKDKELFWVKDQNGEDRVAFQLMTVNNKVIVMGEPFGDDDYLEEALDDFVRRCDRYGYAVVFYEISERLTLKLHEYGYHFMKVGESGVVDLDAFTLSGKKKRPLRYVINKFSGDGYRFEIVHAPHSEVLLDKLETISDEWLNGRDEKGFSMGFFDREYLQMGDIAVVYDTNDEPIAFANIMPVYEKGMMSIDLMRYNPDNAPNSLMDYLFINLFLHAKESGYQTFDLGMAPLSKVGHDPHSFTLERLAYYVYLFGTRIYSFQGLRSYKEKFARLWISKYISFSHGSWRLYSIIALLLATGRTVKVSKGHQINR